MCGPEILNVLCAEHHGKGYAVEAARTVIERVRETTDVTSMCLTTDAPNTGSRIVAEKLGFAEVAVVTAYGADDMVFYARDIRR